MYTYTIMTPSPSAFKASPEPPCSDFSAGSVPQEYAQISLAALWEESVHVVSILSSRCFRTLSVDAIAELLVLHPVLCLAAEPWWSQRPSMINPPIYNWSFRGHMVAEVFAHKLHTGIYIIQSILLCRNTRAVVIQVIQEVPASLLGWLSWISPLPGPPSSPQPSLLVCAWAIYEALHSRKKQNSDRCQ